MTVQTTHYHIGWNMPGYLPEMEPWMCTTADYAKQAMIGELEYHADNEQSWVEEHDCDDIPCPTYEDDCGWNRAESLSAMAEDLNLADVSQGWDGWTDRLHYWISPCVDECEEEESW